MHQAPARVNEGIDLASKIFRNVRWVLPAIFHFRRLFGSHMDMHGTLLILPGLQHFMQYGAWNRTQ
jgi:hypothetical protein